MKNTIDLQSTYLKIVLQILQKHLPPKATVSLFGSRATGKAKKFSDIDLVIEAEKPISNEILVALANDFEESDLPYKVDIVDWATIDNAFQDRIKNDKILIFPPINPAKIL
ncbi:MAG TPA: nucleotidyltransferase domain-containing protein [Gammaproteobacteria bacterium]|nr:nucleotidyltransferase domain-containing protein [Gammaproteobacteria bacterium]